MNPTPIRLLASVALAALLTGCAAVGPNFTRPAPLTAAKDYRPADERGAASPAVLSESGEAVARDPGGAGEDGVGGALEGGGLEGAGAEGAGGGIRVRHWKAAAARAGGRRAAARGPGGGGSGRCRRRGGPGSGPRGSPT